MQETLRRIAVPWIPSAVGESQGEDGQGLPEFAFGMESASFGE